MKAYEVLMYLLIVNGILSMFTIVGIYSTAANLATASPEYTVQSILGLTGWSGIGSIGAATLAMVLLAKAGVNPFSAFAFGAVVAIFIGIYIKVFGVMSEIAASMEGYSNIMYGMIALIGTIFAITFLWGLIQMATGGGRGQDA